MLTTKYSDAKILLSGLVILASLTVGLLLTTQVECQSPIKDTLTLRFCQNFFSVFSLIPTSIISLGGTIVLLGLGERKIHAGNVTCGIIASGSFMILIGLGIFGFYLLD